MATDDDHLQPSKTRESSADGVAETLTGAEKTLDECLKQNEQLRAELSRKEAREAELVLELGSKDEELRELKMHLSALRERPVSETEASGSAVQRSLDQISQTVEDLASDFLEEVSNETGERFDEVVTSGHVSMLNIGGPNPDRAGLVFLAEELAKAEGTVGDLLEYGMGAIIVSQIQFHLFDVFKPGSTDAEEAFMKRALEDVAIAELQSTYSQFRKTLYTRVNPMTSKYRSTLASSISARIIRTLTDFLSRLQAWSPTFRLRWEAELNTLILNCLHWHEMTKGMILEWDYQAIVGDLEVPLKEEDQIIAFRGFGLVKMRRVLVGGKVKDEAFGLMGAPGVRIKDLRRRGSSLNPEGGE